MGRAFLTFLLGACWMLNASAAQYKWKEFSFSMDVPSTWQSANDFMGVPVTMFAPMKGERRDVLQVMPTKAKPLKFSEDEKKAFDKNYLARTKKYVHGRNGKIIKVLPANIEQFDGKPMLVAGRSYSWGLRSYTEKTYYLNCGETLYHLKFQGDPAKPESIKETERVLRTFKCAK